MSAELEELVRQMTVAAESNNFEEARRLRDQINLIRGGASPEEAARADTSTLSRQKTGAMGIGTNKSKPITPPGWKAPPKPDLMTGRRTKAT